MSDKQERLTEEQLDKKLEMFLENKATHHTAECTRRNYLAGKIDRNDLAEACIAMATTAMEIATTNRTQPTDIKKEMMEAHNIFADKEIQEVMDKEDKWK
nr:unnamed protein product [Leishmania braziliensis]CAJ2466346.1 unnamed protein product [Leishmania braziliensis]